MLRTLSYPFTILIKGRLYVSAYGTFVVFVFMTFSFGDFPSYIHWWTVHRVYELANTI